MGGIMSIQTSPQVEKLAGQIADAIVELVERADGPVTLSRIEREVPGFAKHDGSSWEYAVGDNSGDMVIWSGMTEAGWLALREVIRGRRVALQPAIPVDYMFEDWLPQSENWSPTLLLPARMANVSHPAMLFRFEPSIRDGFLAKMAALGKQDYVPVDQA